MEGLPELGLMSFKNSMNFDWWSLGTAVALTIAVALLVLSLLPVPKHSALYASHRRGFGPSRLRRGRRNRPLCGEHGRAHWDGP